MSNNPSRKAIGGDSRVLSCRLSREFINELNTISERYKLPKSQILKHALSTYLEIVKNIGGILNPNFKISPSSLSLSRRGNCTFIRFPNGMVLTLTCISSGSVGPKPMDEIKVDGFTLGKLIARAALMEILSTGSWPIHVSASLCIEMNPFEIEIVKGIKSEMVKIYLDPLILSVDTEENFHTVQTGLGVNVVGFSYERNLRIGKAQVGDIIVMLGKPCLGYEVVKADLNSEILSLKELLKLLELPFIHEVIPVDSDGALSKAYILAKSIGRNINIYDVKPNLQEPAGPATSIIAAIDRHKLNEIQKHIDKPYLAIGEIT
jgi:hypothetical protein